MASPLYNNKTLAEQEQKRKLGVTLETPEPSTSEYVDDGEADRLMAEARATLASAHQFGADNATDRLAALPGRLAAIAPKTDTRGPVRQYTEPLAHIGDAAMAASLPAMVNPAISAMLGIGGGLATVPDYLRRVIAPEGDEERPGLMETGGEALALMPALSSLRTAGKTGRVGQFVRAASEEIPYRAGGSAVLDGARGAEQAEANAILRRANRPPQDIRDSPAMKGLREAVSPKAPSPVEQFYRGDPQARIGGEGRMTGQFTEGAGGLDDISSGNFRRNNVPSPTDSRMTGLAPEESPLATLDALQMPSHPEPSAQMQALLAKLGGRQVEPALSPAQRLAKLPGMMSDADVQAAQDLRWKQGKSRAPSAQTAKARREGKP